MDLEKNITIITHTSKENLKWSESCIMSQKNYTKNHEMNHIIYEGVNVFQRDITWSRFRLIQEKISEKSNEDVIVWMDSDLLIMDPYFDLRSLVDQFMHDPALICFFPLGGMLDLGLIIIKPDSSLKEIFEFGWDVGKIEAHGNRRDKFSFELMQYLNPAIFKSASAENIVSNWYPTGPNGFFNQKVDSSEGSIGKFWFKRPTEMLNNYPDLYLPGCFAVHLHQKGPRLKETATDFLNYRSLLTNEMEEAKKFFDYL